MVPGAVWVGYRRLGFLWHVVDLLHVVLAACLEAVCAVAFLHPAVSRCEGVVVGGSFLLSGGFLYLTAT